MTDHDLTRKPEVKNVREALAELVECRDAFETLLDPVNDSDYEQRRKALNARYPLAWSAARAALAQEPAPTTTEVLISPKLGIAPADDLVRRLRDAAGPLDDTNLTDDAADRIEALQERAELRSEREWMAKVISERDNKIEQLRIIYDAAIYRAEAAEARAAAAERERDALYRFARLNGLMAIDIQNAIDAARGAK